MDLRKYRCPKKDKKFKKYWDLLIADVVERDNFKGSHLLQLELLCDMFVDYATMKEIVEREGVLVDVDTRYGDRLLPHPLTTRIDKTLVTIRTYCKLLGIETYRDTKVKEPEGADEWD